MVEMIPGRRREERERERGENARGEIRAGEGVRRCVENSVSEIGS